MLSGSDTLILAMLMPVNGGQTSKTRCYFYLEKLESHNIQSISITIGTGHPLQGDGLRIKLNYYPGLLVLWSPFICLMVRS